MNFNIDSQFGVTIGIKTLTSSLRISCPFIFRLEGGGGGKLEGTILNLLKLRGSEIKTSEFGLEFGNFVLKCSSVWKEAKIKGGEIEIIGIGGRR